jgi:hypothetical protein
MFIKESIVNPTEELLVVCGDAGKMVVIKERATTLKKSLFGVGTVLVQSECSKVAYLTKLTTRNQ